MSPDEKIIINKLKCGDDDAYRYLFDVHYTSLCHTAFSFLKDTFLAETIVGDVIFHLWEKRESIDIKISLRSYLVRSVRNRCINYMKQEYVLREHASDLTDEIVESGGVIKISQDYPLAILIEKELEAEVFQAIQKLPYETRTVFKLSRFEDLKYVEIAEKLGISVNTVKYHMKNALSRLSNDLDKYLLCSLIFFKYLF